MYRVTSLCDSISRTAIPFIGLKVEERRDLFRAVREHLTEGAVLAAHGDTLPLVPYFEAFQAFPEHHRPVGPRRPDIRLTPKETDTLRRRENLVAHLIGRIAF